MQAATGEMMGDLTVSWSPLDAPPHAPIRKLLAVLVALLSATIVLAGCAGGAKSMTPEETQKDALALLDHTTTSTDLDWSSPGDPVSKKCSEGVRYQYMVHAPVTSKQTELADSLAEFWRSKGLQVERSQQEFGAKYGTVYAATAKADGKAGAAFEITNGNALVYVNSRCVAGSPDDEQQPWRR
ncbi:hypothetical protein NYS48_06325 [Curtobacterium flaccumfaciens pv. flaccumfaciens]|uniref:hypothetical protein n=2 Tax=Curtobacterium TaxID=2034 RepID=UPI00217ECFD4|nr:hypothetical protein [Curtobacterium flaccumfaciens]MCS6564929.1 hypothetical protein [Curtobacterium flaccumfaciens pv. flaccumfaciens]